MGFPSGKRLVDIIAHQWDGKEFRDDNYVQMLQECDLDHKDLTIQQFYNNLRSQPLDSIDRYLNINPHHEQIGKIAIAYEILKIESTHSANIFIRLLRDPHKTHENNAYKYILNNTTTPDPLQQLSDHQFITFNYDRMFEHYIYHAARSMSSMTHERAMTYLSTLSLVHVYGSLGPYEPSRMQRVQRVSKFTNLLKEDTDDEEEIIVTSYQDSHQSSYVKTAATNLRLMKEDRANPSVEKAITKILKNTDLVVFLGFGYDPLNCSIIRRCSISNGLSTHRRRRWIGSAYEKYEAERQKIAASIDTDFDHLGAYEDNDVVFMRKFL